MKPISILLICDSYPPVLGGSEIEAQRVAAALIAKGHKVEVLCAGGPPMPAQRRWIDPAGVPVQILTRSSKGHLKNITFALQVAGVLWADRKRYDIVYFLMQGLHLVTGLPLARMLGKPMVMKFGGSGVVPLMRASRAGRWELDWMQEHRIPVLILNDGMRQEALADGFASELITWMPNPVDTEEFRPAQPGEKAELRRRFGLNEDAIVTTYVGRLSHEKGLPELLRGFAAAAAQFSPTAILLLIGDGAQRAELEALATQLGVAQFVRFVGRVGAQEVPLWLGASDIFTLISPSEGFSCALLEAMACGLASVVSDIPANGQLIEHGKNGLTVPFGDDAAAGQAFASMIRDAALRKRCGEAARATANSYSTSQVAARYESLFTAMLARPR